MLRTDISPLSPLGVITSNSQTTTYLTGNSVMPSAVGEGGSQGQDQSGTGGRGGGGGRSHHRGQHRGRGGGGRGGRGNRGRRGGGGRGSTASPQPADQAPRAPTGGSSQATSTASTEPTAPGPQRGRGRGRPGGFRGGRGGQSTRGATVAGTRRIFGGRLTANPPSQDASDPSDAALGGLSAAAPEFVPGQPVTQRKNSRPPPKQPATQCPLGPKSNAADLPTRIHEDISNGQYECVICSSEVLRSSRVWSCTLCWTVVHLPCLKKWHKSQVEQAPVRQDGQPKSWRCPGCNSTLTEIPGSHHCWCGKDINPPNVPGLPPHSCGQTCTKPRSTCPHPCYSECHAGPCPPCGLMGPTQSCFCGKHEVTKRCADTEYDVGWSCLEICSDVLPCGEHECERQCHPGLCGSCSVPVLAICYCGKSRKEIPCDERDEAEVSFNYGQIKDVEGQEYVPGGPFEGSFDCGAPCGRQYDCGHHECEKTCHPQDEITAHCPWSPDVVLTCPCGKTPLDQFLGEPRQSCQDPVPHCGETCGKLMACGHSCDQICHTGHCPTCFQKMDISCRCGRVTGKSICHGVEVFGPMCPRICQAQLNCGRHQCGERCCPGEKRAIERQAAKRKNKPQNPDDVEAEHICIRVCGRALKCGTHTCQQICHRGPCASCPEAVFEEISCSCGRTVLQPPQPCGTQAPECRFDCTRPTPCGHPAVEHSCHPDDMECPKCPFLVERLCVCGKQRVKNVPCWFAQVRCGLPCGEKLKCGAHNCRKTCHESGQCEDAGNLLLQCTQPCGKSRKSCGHIDQELCHAPFPCKEDTPCLSKSFITCPCQNLKKEVKCLATLANPEPQREPLKCDDECLRLQRNQRLASALSIDPATHSDDFIPYSDSTLRFFRDNLRWAQTQEREFRVFASDPAEKRLRLKPMPSHQRAFLHSLAEDFGFDTESQDPEPHRHVCIFKTPKFVSAPSKTLEQCIRIRNSQVASAARVGATPSELLHMLREPVVPKSSNPFNSLLITSPRFALTVEELDSALAKHFADHNTLTFKTSFLPSDEVLIRGTPFTSWGSSASAVETSLSTLKPIILRTLMKEGLAAGVTLAHADTDLNILRRETNDNKDGSGNGVGESGGGGGGGGWNAVVGRAAKGRTSAQVASGTKKGAASGSKSGSGFVSFSKTKKKVVEETAEDWEVAAEGME